ncbi:histidine phosphatase family protein [Thiohalorhabdus methylotrophus]|uniref:Histidine phosphatase family protein n=1 Tax=Thiohalorhabdus methylotrophus TaxID=3242694 RepID=A0ABV4TTV8_9GAMM
MNQSGTVVDLIRHGEPEGGRMFRGRTDHPLSDKGWGQMRLASAGEEGWEAVVSSPLLRCSEFARDLAHARGLHLQYEPRLREMDFGEWDGRTAEDVLANGPGDLSAFWADPPNAQAPGGEALTDFAERVLAGWEDIVRTYTGQHVLVVGHGGVMRVLIAHVLGMPLENLFRMEVGYACRTRIRAHADGEQITARLVAHGVIV